MSEMILASYLGGFASIVLFALRERPPGTCVTDFCVAVVIALWPLAMLAAVFFRAYRALQPRR
jgi:hypothetical protein